MVSRYDIAHVDPNLSTKEFTFEGLFTGHSTYFALGCKTQLLKNFMFLHKILAEYSLDKFEYGTIYFIEKFAVFEER